MKIGCGTRFDVTLLLKDSQWIIDNENLIKVKKKHNQTNKQTYSFMFLFFSFRM